MIVPPLVTSKIEFARPYLEAVGSKVKDLVLAHCERHGFAFMSRHKEAESLAEKIETGRYENWSDLDDLFACTIVVPTLTYEEPILEFLKTTFLEVVTRKRGSSQKDPSVFRFDSTRFIGKLRPPSSDDASEEVFKILFEIQIRTAFEHAWSVTTHALSYKAQQVDWRNLRLTAQLKASVEQLDNLILGFEESAKFISEHYWPEVQAMKNLEQFFAGEIRKGAIPQEVQPSNWTRFCENVVSLLKSSNRRERGVRPDQLADEAITVLHTEISTLTLSSFPRSISLLQFVFGVLAKTRTINAPFHRYYPVVTRELVELYPGVAGFEQTFNFNG